MCLNLLNLLANMEGLKLQSAWLKQKDGDLTQVEVDEVLGFVGNIWTEVTAYK